MVCVLEQQLLESAASLLSSPLQVELLKGKKVLQACARQGCVEHAHEAQLPLQCLRCMGCGPQPRSPKHVAQQVVVSSASAGWQPGCLSKKMHDNIPASIPAWCV